MYSDVLTGDFYFLDAFVRVVLYMNVDGDRLAVVIELFVQRSLQVQLVRAHHELLAHLDRRLFALLARSVHDFPYGETNRVPVNVTIVRIRHKVKV